MSTTRFSSGDRRGIFFDLMAAEMILTHDVADDKIHIDEQYGVGSPSQRCSGGGKTWESMASKLHPGAAVRSPLGDPNSTLQIQELAKVAYSPEQTFRANCDEASLFSPTSSLGPLRSAIPRWLQPLAVEQALQIEVVKSLADGEPTEACEEGHELDVAAGICCSEGAASPEQGAAAEQSAAPLFAPDADARGAARGESTPTTAVAARASLNPSPPSSTHALLHERERCEAHPAGGHSTPVSESAAEEAEAHANEQSVALESALESASPQPEWREAKFVAPFGTAPPRACSFEAPLTRRVEVLGCAIARGVLKRSKPFAVYHLRLELPDGLSIVSSHRFSDFVDLDERLERAIRPPVRSMLGALPCTNWPRGLPRLPPKTAPWESPLSRSVIDLRTVELQKYLEAVISLFAEPDGFLAMAELDRFFGLQQQQ